MSNAADKRVWQQMRDAQTWSLPEFQDEFRGREEPTPSAPPTAAELADIRAQFEKDGYDAGMAKGYAEGLKAGETEIREGIERLHVIASALAAPLDELDKDLEYSLVNLALILARRIVGRSVFDDAEALASLVRQAVEMLGSEMESQVDIYLNPRDLQFLQQHDKAESGWALHADDTLLSGDVRVQRGLAEVDARLQQRLDRLAAEMLNG